jgi:hypothetical protein
MLLNTKKKRIKLIETLFNVIYLSVVLISAALLCFGADAGVLRFGFGVMAFILVAGDAFHLVPRICAMWDDRSRNYTAMLGIGKLIASITMTVFYVMLWNIGMTRYTGIMPAYMTKVVYVLAALRVALCLFPQNRWLHNAQPFKWGVLRNIPFFVLGILVMILFAIAWFTRDGMFSFLWVYVLLSFAFYLPVVLFAGKNPKVGMLMLLKSCAYVAIVLTGFSLPGV